MLRCTEENWENGKRSYELDDLLLKAFHFDLKFCRVIILTEPTFDLS